MSTTSHEREKNFEQSVKRNPHPDFKKVEASRPDWREKVTEDGGGPPLYTKTRDPAWKLGQGGNDNDKSLEKEHVSIDPYEEGRPAVFNYKLMISAIVPRPIGFLSTVGKDGMDMYTPTALISVVLTHGVLDNRIVQSGTFQLFPNGEFRPANLRCRFSCKYEGTKRYIGQYHRNEGVYVYTHMFFYNHGGCSSVGLGVVNVISEHFVEAANACSINSPYGISEWSLVGLHPAPTKKVKPSRVKEAVFAAECTLVEVKEWQSKAKPDTASGAMAILEGVNFWVREDAINEEKNGIDLNVCCLFPCILLG